MRISDIEVNKILNGEYALVDFETSIQTRDKDADLIKQVTAEVIAMPERDELIAELKARIQSGSYNPTGDEIADAMIRRSIADRIKG
jgi:anti-sigma28 factor (negative regulator of flagellin synthesis)